MLGGNAKDDNETASKATNENATADENAASKANENAKPKPARKEGSNLLKLQISAPANLRHGSRKREVRPTAKVLANKSDNDTSASHSKRQTRSGTMMTKSLEARASHVESVAALDKGLEVIGTIIENLKLDEENGELAADISHLISKNHRADISNADALNCMVALLDDPPKNKSNIEYALGVIGCTEVPDPLVEKVRYQGERAVKKAIRNKAQAKTRKLQRAKQAQKVAEKAAEKAAADKKAAEHAKETAEKEAQDALRKLENAQKESGRQKDHARNIEQQVVSAEAAKASGEVVDGDAGETGTTGVADAAQMDTKMEMETNDVIENDDKSKAKTMAEIIPVATAGTAAPKSKRAEPRKSRFSSLVDHKAEQLAMKQKSAGDTAAAGVENKNTDEENVPSLVGAYNSQEESEEAASGNTSENEDENEGETDDVKKVPVSAVTQSKNNNNKKSVSEAVSTPATTPTPSSPMSTRAGRLSRRNSPAVPPLQAKTEDIPNHDIGSSLVEEKAAKKEKKQQLTRTAKGQFTSTKATTRPTRKKAAPPVDTPQESSEEEEEEESESDEEMTAENSVAVPVKPLPAKSTAKVGGSKVKGGVNTRKRKAPAATPQKTEDMPSAASPAPSEGGTTKSSKKKKTDIPPREKRVSGRRSGRLRRESGGLVDGGDGSAWNKDKYMGMCYRAWNAILSVAISIPFREPVDAKDAPGYFDIIKKPMDLATIKQKMADGTLKNPAEFHKDLQQIVKNAQVYNSKDSDIYELAVLFKKKVAKEVDPILDEWKAHGKPSAGEDAAGGANEEPGAASNSGAATPKNTRSSARYPRRSTAKAVPPADVASPSTVPDEDEEEEEPVPPPKRNRGRGTRKRAAPVATNEEAEESEDEAKNSRHAKKSSSKKKTSKAKGKASSKKNDEPASKRRRTKQ